MNRVVRLTMVLSFLGFLGACDQKGPLRVDRVEPAEGVASGGDLVNIVGNGFQPGKTQVQVRFGGKTAENVVISANNKIAVVTPAGTKGPVDVVLSFDDGAQFKIPSGFKYVAPAGGEDVRKAFFGKGNEKK
jgi:IPT/TIG domain